MESCHVDDDVVDIVDVGNDDDVDDVVDNVNVGDDDDVVIMLMMLLMMLIRPYNFHEDTFTDS